MGEQDDDCVLCVCVCVMLLCCRGVLEVFFHLNPSFFSLVSGISIPNAPKVAVRFHNFPQPNPREGLPIRTRTGKAKEKREEKKTPITNRVPY